MKEDIHERGYLERNKALTYTQPEDCINDLAPTIVSCADALARLGLNPIANINCLNDIHDDILETVSDFCGFAVWREEAETD